MNLSNSALTCLQQCGEKFRRRYIEKEVIPPFARMIRGSAVHHAAKTAMLRKMQDGSLPTEEEAKDLAASAFEAHWQGGVTLQQDEISEGIGKVRAESKDFSVDLSAFHVLKVAPAIRPVGVERKIMVKPQDSDVTIHGTIDLVDAGSDGEETIRDLKTSAKSPAPHAADVSQQLTLYALLRQIEVGKIPAHLVLDYLVRTPVKAEKKHVVLRSERTEDDLHAMVQRINRAVEAVHKGAFLPAPSDAWYCSLKWCEYFPTCPYVVHGKRREIDE